MADLDIDTKAAEPQQVTVDGQTVVQRPVADLIAAELHENRRENAARTGFPMRFFKVRPPGAV